MEIYVFHPLSFIFFRTHFGIEIRNWHRFSNLDFRRTYSWLPEGHRACLLPLLYKSRATVAAIDATNVSKDFRINKH